MLRSKFALQLTQEKRIAGAVPPEHRLEFSTSRQTGRCRVSFRRIGRIGPDSWTSFARSAAAEISSGKVLFAFLQGGSAPALSLYNDRTNPITKLGTANRRLG